MAAAVLRESPVVAAIEDTSEHVLMKRALAQSLHRYLELFEQLPIGLYEARADGTLLLANPALRELLGYGSDEIALAAEWCSATQWQGESWQAFLTEAERTGPGGSLPLVSRAVETEWRRRDGVMLQVRQHVRLHWDRAGRLSRVAATVEEVTALRQAQRELEAAADLLRLRNEQLDQALRQTRHAGEAKTRFLAAMSHEIRTPLNAVSAAGELLLAAPLGEDERRLVEMIERSVRHLAALVDDVLDLAGVESGLWDLNPGPVRLREILTEALHPFERGARAKGLDFRCQIDPRLPEEAVADGRRLQQIVCKLVDNAVKYTESGEVVVEAALSQMLERPALCFTVSDTGPGIADDLLARIFEPFVQGESGPARRHGGAGLGLAMARQLVEKMDGHLGMMVRPGGGCRFWFEVPLMPAAVVTKKPDSCSTGSAGRDGPLDRRIRVLIVEDNAVNRQLAARMLTRAGMEVETVESADDGIRRLCQEPFDVVLMDVHMPGMDGREATRRLRRMGTAASRVPIIALTASVLPEDRIACAEAGMDDFLGKPFRLQELVETVRRWAQWRGGEAAVDRPVRAMECLRAAPPSSVQCG